MKYIAGHQTSEGLIASDLGEGGERGRNTSKWKKCASFGSHPADVWED